MVEAVLSPRRLLKTRVTFLTLVLFVPGLWSLASIASRNLHQSMLEKLGQQQRDLLAQMGCHACQGYLFDRPLPIAEFEALLAPQLSLPPHVSLRT